MTEAKIVNSDVDATEYKDMKNSVDWFDVNVLWDEVGLVTILGCRGSGVTTAQLNVVDASGINRGFAYAPTSETFSESLPPVYVHDRLDEKALEHLRAYQQQEKSSMFWLVDNIACDPASMQSNTLQSMLAESESLKCLTVLTAQYWMDVPKKVRQATRWWFIHTRVLATAKNKLASLLTLEPDDHFNRDRIWQALTEPAQQTPHTFIVVPGATNPLRKQENKHLQTNKYVQTNKHVPFWKFTPQLINTSTYLVSKEQVYWGNLAFDPHKIQHSVASNDTSNNKSTSTEDAKTATATNTNTITKIPTEFVVLMSRHCMKDCFLGPKPD